MQISEKIQSLEREHNSFSASVDIAKNDVRCERADIRSDE